MSNVRHIPVDVPEVEVGRKSATVTHPQLLFTGWGHEALLLLGGGGLLGHASPDLGLPLLFFIHGYFYSCPTSVTNQWLCVK